MIICLYKTLYLFLKRSVLLICIFNCQTFSQDTNDNVSVTQQNLINFGVGKLTLIRNSINEVTPANEIYVNFTTNSNGERLEKISLKDRDTTSVREKETKFTFKITSISQKDPELEINTSTDTKSVSLKKFISNEPLFKNREKYMIRFFSNHNISFLRLSRSDRGEITHYIFQKN